MSQPAMPCLDFMQQELASEIKATLCLDEKQLRLVLLQAVNFRAHKHICDVFKKKQRASRLRAIEHVLWGTKEKSGAC